MIEDKKPPFGKSAEELYRSIKVANNGFIVVIGIAIVSIMGFLGSSWSNLQGDLVKYSLDLVVHYFQILIIVFFVSTVLGSLLEGLKPFDDKFSINASFIIIVPWYLIIAQLFSIFYNKGIVFLSLLAKDKGISIENAGFWFLM